MAKHGYRRPYGWHANVGSCFGAGKLPWEVSPAGAVEYAEFLKRDLAAKRGYMAKVASGTVPMHFDVGTIRHVVVTVHPDGSITTQRPEDSGAVERFRRDLEHAADSIAYKHGYQAAVEWRAMTTQQKAISMKLGELNAVVMAVEREINWISDRVVQWKPGTLWDV